MVQEIINTNGSYEEVRAFLQTKNIHKIFIVSDVAMHHLHIGTYLKRCKDFQIEIFSDFRPNPDYEAVVAGVKLFQKKKYDAIFAIGGGSAMDVAKCIKLFSNMDERSNYLEQSILANALPLYAMPTTAGTGSEATRYAVIYYKGEKQNITDDSLVPTMVVMDPTVLQTLPDYQKKATMMDALGHAIESFWSIHATNESQAYAIKAINTILTNQEDYLSNALTANAPMQKAANDAGKAINITRTTAAHAMAYKLTSLYDIAHGHAVGLCIAKLLPYMETHRTDSLDPRGQTYINNMFAQLCALFNCNTLSDLGNKIDNKMMEMGLWVPVIKSMEDYRLLTTSVNPQRLRNHPVRLDEVALNSIYRQIVREIA